MQNVRKLWSIYRMRLKRRRLLFRAWRKRGQIQRLAFKADQVRPDDILAFTTLRNEMSRLPYFLNYYRNLGVQHFFVVDNGSDDGSTEFLTSQPDVSVWTTNHSYRLSRFGVDWLTCLQYRFGHGHWCLTVDADELLVYPNSETRNLSELVRFLNARGLRSFGALMLDMYPKGTLGKQKHTGTDNPIKTLGWFDAFGYFAQKKPDFDALWTQGGVRARMFFQSDLRRAPTMNKTPLVKWDKTYAYLNSTHSILPPFLNHVYDCDGEEKTTGALLHTKFLPQIVEKSAEEKQRKEHFENSELYSEYYDQLVDSPDLWYEGSTKYTGTSQLVQLGLMWRGSW